MSDLVYNVTNILIEGDPLNPASTDIIVQDGMLETGDPVPEGWVVMTGNQYLSRVMRIAYRYQIEDEITANWVPDPLDAARLG